MIVFGSDERFEWARKTGMFLARARTALGDRRLHRNAWGGSVLDSVVGAMLTQNVSDVLSSSAIMNLAARFPGKGATVSSGHRVSTATNAVVAETLATLISNAVDAGEMNIETTRISKGDPSVPREAEDDCDEKSEIALPVNEEEEEESDDQDEEHIFQKAFGSSSPIQTRSPPIGARSPPITNTDDNSIRNPTRIPSELVSATSGASAIAAAGGIARSFPNAGSELATANDRDPPFPSMELRNDGHVPPDSQFPPSDASPGTPAIETPRNTVAEAPTPPEPSRRAAASFPPRKKTKDRVLREERLAFAAKALLIPDPSPRPEETLDLIDWRAVMHAPMEAIVECIQCRGMHYMLATRIQRVLRRVASERDGDLSLEFLRDASTDEARGYLLSMEGYGVKTVSCILLLALYRSDFPVDVNVGRIMARLGWVPLETEEALEELSEYAPEPAVYTFLRARLNSFGLQTLFELHYHMITLGKVFCEKRVPNCGACPLRDMCEYAHSGGKHRVKERGSEAPTPSTPVRAAAAASAATILVENTSHESEKRSDADAARNVSIAVGDLEDASSRGLDDVLVAGKAWDANGRPPVGAPAVLFLDPGAGLAEAKLAHARLSRRVHPDKCPDSRAARAFELITAARNAMGANIPIGAHGSGGSRRDEIVRVDANNEVVVGPRSAVDAADGDTSPRHDPAGSPGSREIGDLEDIGRSHSTPVLLSRPDKGFARVAAEAAASLAASPLQLRTRLAQTSTNRVRHELIAWSLPPDLIPDALRQRAPEVDADCYLAVRCALPSAIAAAERASANAGCEVTPLSILVPCRAAVYAKFPLHGTYFQTNEVFLDAETAVAPKIIPARRLEFLPTVSVFLGSSVASICRGMTRAEVAAAFANRAVCVRSWDASDGGRPRPLPKWACPFVPKAGVLGAAPGEENAFFRETSREASVARAAADPRGASRRSAGELARGSLSRVSRGAEAIVGDAVAGVAMDPGTVPSDRERGDPPASAEDTSESDDDRAMDARRDSFLAPRRDAASGLRGRVPTEINRARSTEGAPRSIPAVPEPHRGTFDRVTGKERDSTRLHVSETASPWNSRTLFAFAARRKEAAAAAKRARAKRAKRLGSLGADPSASAGDADFSTSRRVGSGAARARTNEPSVRAFFSPAA